jgi:DNA-binding SARP family transcriptional activator
MKEELEIRVLGDFSFVQEGRLVEGLDSPRLQALLTCLLLHRGAPQLRQHLAFLFWLDSDEAQARTNLRNLIHRLRQVWPEADRYLAIGSRSISWRPDVRFTLDLTDFEAQLERARTADSTDDEIEYLQRAIRLYRSDLLPGCYDDWIQPERARLRQAFLQALERLSDLLRARGDYQAAIHAFERLIQAEPLQEASYRQLMACYARNGDRAAALKVYHHCVTTLRQELGLAPDAATQAAYRQLLLPDTPVGDLPAPSVPLDIPLVGRAVEWEQLLQAWRDVAVGRQPTLLVLIRGEAGVGKTRLAAELADWVERRGPTVASAACYAPESDLSLMPVAAWLRMLPLDGLPAIWRSELSRLLPELADRASTAVQSDAISGVPPDPSVEPWQKRRFYAALVRAILIQAQPVLLRLEDLQWSDTETLSWLHYLLRLEENARLMVVATLRTEEMDRAPLLGSMLSALRQQGRLLEIELGLLDSAGTAALAASLLGEALAPDAAMALYRHTEGNPLFIMETICHEMQCDESTSTLRALLEAPQSPAWNVSTPLSPKIQAVLHDRLAQLSAGARALLEAASVIGRSFTLDILSNTLDVREDEMVTALDELWRRRIVRTRDGGAYDFSHNTLRQTVYTTLSPTRRRWLHGRVAWALEIGERSGVEPPIGQLALHYEAAGQAEQAFRTHCRAAESAQRLYAYPAAAFHLRSAIALLEELQQDDLQVGLYEQLGDVLTLSGQHTEARQAYGAAIAALEPHNDMARAALSFKASETGLAQQNQGTAERALEEGLGKPASADGFNLLQ